MEEKNCSLTFFQANLTGPRMSIKEVVPISKFRARAQSQLSVEKRNEQNQLETKPLHKVVHPGQNRFLIHVAKYIPRK